MCTSHVPVCIICSYALDNFEVKEICDQTGAPGHKTTYINYIPKENNICRACMKSRRSVPSGQEGQNSEDDETSSTKYDRQPLKGETSHNAHSQSSNKARSPLHPRDVFSGVHTPHVDDESNDEHEVPEPELPVEGHRKSHSSERGGKGKASAMPKSDEKKRQEWRGRKGSPSREKNEKVSERRAGRNDNPSSDSRSDGKGTFQKERPSHREYRDRGCQTLPDEDNKSSSSLQDDFEKIVLQHREDKADAKRERDELQEENDRLKRELDGWRLREQGRSRQQYGNEPPQTPLGRRKLASAASGVRDGPSRRQAKEGDADLDPGGFEDAIDDADKKDDRHGRHERHSSSKKKHKRTWF